MDESARFFVRDPAGLAGRGGNLAVEALSPLKEDEGSAFAVKLEEGGIEASGGRSGWSECYFYACLTEFLDALAGDLLGGVFGGDNYPGQAGAYEGLGAGGGLALVAAGLESYVHTRAGWGLGAIVQGDDLGVWGAEVVVMASGDDAAIADDDGADHGIGLYAAATPGG